MVSNFRRVQRIDLLRDILEEDNMNSRIDQQILPVLDRIQRSGAQRTAVEVPDHIHGGVSGQSRISIPLGSFTATAGSPTLGEPRTNIAGWAFSPTAVETIAVSIAVPPDYGGGGFVAAYYYEMATGNSGDVRWIFGATSFAEGEVVTLGSTVLIDDAVPGTLHDLGIAVLPITTPAANIGELLSLQVERDGAATEDDATGDANLLMVELRYAKA